jgi:tRNA1(Val) A37 N6-methylase TrmN6
MIAPVSGFKDDNLTRDAFLGGRFHLLQPRRGYRAGIDPILLAAAVPARAGQAVLDLGCGTGAAILALGARVPGLTLAGLELQPAYADLARRNAIENGIALRVVSGNLADMPAQLRQRQFDHVIANPPYFDAARRSPAQDAGRETALAEATPIRDWVTAASRRLRPGALAHFIHRVERLPDLLSACEGRLGSLEVLPLCAREGRAPVLMILRGRKGGRANFMLHPARALHQNPEHDRDRDSYHTEIGAVFRKAAALRWP